MTVYESMGKPRSPVLRNHNTREPHTVCLEALSGKPIVYKRTETADFYLHV